MKILAKSGNEKLATVYIAEMPNNKKIEFVESIQPPLTREEKWVLIISTLYGCPVKCRFCDAGCSYSGTLSTQDLIKQIDYLVTKHYPDRKVLTNKFKIQFSRIGDPAFNLNILEVLDIIQDYYKVPGLIPSLSTIAPSSTDQFFDDLINIKKRKYPDTFQLQFSIHTTDEEIRDWLIPVKKWSFDQIAEYGQEFYNSGGKKITLNFALAEQLPVEPDILVKYFSPQFFIIKVTPLNPTCQVKKNKMNSLLPHPRGYEKVDQLRQNGYEVIVSIGEYEENQIGSNCGQYLTTYLNHKIPVDNAYTYDLVVQPYNEGE